MSISTDLVFDETSTYIATPCPEWCTLRPLHPVDNGVVDGPSFRIHGGRAEFGKYLHGYGEEYTDEPGVLYVGVELDTGGLARADEAHRTMTHLDLIQLADDARDAGAWLTAQLRGSNCKPVEVRR